MRRALVLVEGQTEERFVKDTLRPHLERYNVHIDPKILVTKVVKSGSNFKGGIKSFGQFERDLRLLLGGAGSALVTTIFDYYRLPADFPGMTTRPPTAEPVLRIAHVEQSVGQHFADQRFLPFFALHEFEAWIFSCPDTLPNVVGMPDKQKAFASTCQTYPTPEHINERPGYNPASRIQKLFPPYRKTLHGPTATNRIGLQAIRQKCPHFAAWIASLEQFGQC